mgnify:CR=1 FL=1
MYGACVIRGSGHRAAGVGCRAVALKPGEVEHYKWSLPNVDHVFLPGHKIMVQVQSSLFPLYDRNPQTFVDNILEARPDDFRKQTHSLFHDRRHPSAILLTVKSP